MEETIITLKPGVTLTEQQGQVGLKLCGSTQYAKNIGQAEILRALALRAQPLERLIELLHVRDDPPKNDNEISLAMAEFILDFGEYLES